MPVRLESLPYREDAEQAVLAAVLMGDPATWATISDVLSAGDFYGPGHAAIFAAMHSLAADGVALDPLVLCNQLERAGRLEEIGGKAYVGFLNDAIPTAANVAYHAQIVRQYSEARTLVLGLERETAALRSGAAAPGDAAGRIADLTLKITTSGGRKTGFVSAKEILPDLSASLLDRSKPGNRGVPTGFATFDEHTAGLNPGELMIIAGVPGSGKTALGFQIALHNTVERADREPVAIVSAEMTRRALMERGVCNVGRINTQRLRTMQLMPDEQERIGTAFSILQHAPLHIDDTPTPSLADVAARCRALKTRVPALRLFIVDFLQLLSDANGREDTRAEELIQIAYGLKGLGKSLDAAVIALCQVNDKQVDARADRRPMLGDLQGSSGMRQAADFIALCYRPKMYDATALDDTVQVNIAKAREVGTFVMQLDAQLQYMRLVDVPRYAPSSGLSMVR